MTPNQFKIYTLLCWSIPNLSLPCHPRSFLGAFPTNTRATSSLMKNGPSKSQRFVLWIPKKTIRTLGMLGGDAIYCLSIGLRWNYLFHSQSTRDFDHAITSSQRETRYQWKLDHFYWLVLILSISLVPNDFIPPNESCMHLSPTFNWSLLDLDLEKPKAQTGSQDPTQLQKGFLPKEERLEK